MNTDSEQLREDTHACIELAKRYPFNTREILDAYYSVNKKIRNMHMLTISCKEARLTGRDVGSVFREEMGSIKKEKERLMRSCDIMQAKKELLNKIGREMGIERRFFKIEPDWLYKARLLKMVNPSVDGRGR